MPNLSHEPEDDATSSTCWIVAIARLDSLPELRDALQPIEPLSVTTSVAASWDYGRELQYRGASLRVDESVARLEITCDERQADWILGAIRKVFARTGASPGPMQHVVAMQCGPRDSISASQGPMLEDTRPSSLRRAVQVEDRESRP